MTPPSHRDRFWLLVGLQLDNEASAEELLELEALIRENPGWQADLDQARMVYHFKAYPLQTPDVDKAFSRHMQRLSNHQSRLPETDGKARPGRVFRFSLAAAAVAASVLLIWTIVGKEKAPERTTNVIATRFGSKSKVQLPDGTQVWLNADSRLTYGKDFGNKTREVTLSGEAFFDVQKDADHPFLIHTGSLDIKVLGTAFNVRSYQDEGSSEATLIRGAIEVTLNNSPERKILLKPNERIVVRNKPEADSAQGTVYRMDKVDTRDNGNASLETVWKKNSLSFKNETLEEVAGRIGHWFNVKVDIEDEELKTVTYSCDFKDESLKEVMEALHLTGKFQYRISGDSVVITK